jgi:hypothetical protein
MQLSKIYLMQQLIFFKILKFPTSSNFFVPLLCPTFKINLLFHLSAVRLKKSNGFIEYQLG